MGDSKTHTEGNRLAHFNPYRNRGNLLDFNTLKNIYDYGNEHNEGNTSVPRHNRPVPYDKGGKRPSRSGQIGKSLQDDGAVLRLL